MSTETPEDEPGFDDGEMTADPLGVWVGNRWHPIDWRQAEAEYDRLRRQPVDVIASASKAIADATVGPVGRWLGRMFGKEQP